MILKICLFCLCMATSVFSGGNIPGAPWSVSVDDPEIVRLSNFVLQNLAEKSYGTKKNLVKVVNATVQVVAGTLTTMTLALSEDGEEQICVVKVWERPWLNKTEITDVKCEDVARRKVKRHSAIETGTHDEPIVIFKDFMKKYNKVYASHDEYKKRFRIFRANLQKIKILRENEQGTGVYGVNWFADHSSKEFKQYLGLKHPKTLERLPNAVIPNISLPNEFDWRHYNVVTPVKNQGMCGSCWAFSVTGNIEGQWALKTKELLSLSEQELIDCDTLDDGCAGGYMTNAYKSIKNIGGLETEKNYPYAGDDETCQFNNSKARVQIKGGVNITSNEDDMAKWLVKNGPMSVALNANAMQFYIGGVSHPFKFLCNPEDLNHGVLITGFGVQHSKILKKTLPYWIVKNSWGKHWGELGYYRIFRGDGTCGINKMVSSAIV